MVKFSSIDVAGCADSYFLQTDFSEPLHEIRSCTPKKLYHQLGVYVFLWLCAALALGFSQADAKEEHKLSVSGTATVFKPADILTLVLAVETYDKDINKGTQSNSEKMQAVIKGLIQAGLSDKEFQTKNYTIIPQLTPTPKNPPADWQPSISGYRIRNTLEIRTKRLDIAGQLIDAAVRVGGNAFDSISFSLEHEDEAKAEAITKAFLQAEKYAHALAKEAHVKLEKIMELSINQPYASPFVLKAARLNQESPTPISAREVEVSATVSVVYGLGSE